MTITAGWYNNSKASSVSSAASLTTVRQLASVLLSMNGEREAGVGGPE